MIINEVIDELRDLHLEFGNLINRLEEVDEGEEIEEYEDLLRDYHWDNVMLSNRLQRILFEKGLNK